MADSASGARDFALVCLEAYAKTCAIVKPNVAFFEQYGSAGVGALEEVLAAARKEGILVLADAKRGDISSTSAAYARGWLGEQSPLRSDAITLVAYLGAGALRPFFDAAAASGRGVFVLVRSSNEEGRAIQLARTDNLTSVEETLLAEVAARGETVGAVVGLAKGVRPLALPLGSFYLAPGLGIQGARWQEVRRQFAGLGSTPVVVNMSRSLCAHGPSVGDLYEAAARARDAAAAELRPTRD